MKISYFALPMTIILSLCLVAFAQGIGGRGAAVSPYLDVAEEAHLLYMRTEEKLAHDVYLKLGAEFPDYKIFSNIMNSETRHVIRMLDKLEQFALTDPNIDDGTGEFNPDNYGEYFTEKYNLLTEIYTFEIPLLQALKNGALIEEFDMYDIVYCPEVIVESVDGIDDKFACGMQYTDVPPLVNSYGNLLEGSKIHLRAFVKTIETNFPEESPYQAQYMEQWEVNEILGR